MSNSKTQIAALKSQIEKLIALDPAGEDFEICYQIRECEAEIEELEEE